LQQLLPDSGLKLNECIVEMELLAQARGKNVQDLIKKELSNMPITLSKENSLFYQEWKQEVSIDHAERMLRIGLSPDIVQQCTGLALKTIKGLLKKMQ
jgi:hypothetical protein